MISYEKWKMLNETLGTVNLGIKTPHSLGIKGAVIGEELPSEEDVDSEEADDDTPYDKDSADHSDDMKHMEDGHSMLFSLKTTNPVLLRWCFF